MQHFPILQLCARVKGHPLQYEKIRSAGKDFSNWIEFIRLAEFHGMVPLLHKHLLGAGCQIPDAMRRSLNLLVRRHAGYARIRLAAIDEIMAAFFQQGIASIVLKGAALSATLYDEPGERPMRDVDILLPKENAQEAFDILTSLGYSTSSAPIPPDHYHLPAQFRKEATFTLCFEIHRDLYPVCPPYYPEVKFWEMHENSVDFSCGEYMAKSLGDEDMLNYLYQHGFHCPLTYESFKLINAADFISHAERVASRLDWKEIRQRSPMVYNALTTMHHITPWDPSIEPALLPASKGANRSMEVAPFTGWPAQKLKQQKGLGKSVLQIITTTFFPPRWWLQLYYGVNTSLGLVHTLVVKHPAHIFWWIRLYSTYLKPTGNVKAGGNSSSWGRLQALLVKLFGR